MDAAGPDGRKKKVKVTIWDTGMLMMICEDPDSLQSIDLIKNYFSCQPAKKGSEH